VKEAITSAITLKGTVTTSDSTRRRASTSSRNKNAIRGTEEESNTHKEAITAKWTVAASNSTRSRASTSTKSKKTTRGAEEESCVQKEAITAKRTVTTGGSTRSTTSTSSKKVTRGIDQESNAQKDKPNQKTRQRNWKALNKTEKISVIHLLSCLHNTTLSMLAMMGVSNQLPLPYEDLKDFCDSLPVSTIEFFTEHLKGRFTTLYEECATLSAASDRYL